MDVERQLRRAADRLDDERADADVRDELSVHHVHVDPVGARRFHRAYLFAQTGDVGREDRRSDLRYARRHHTLSRRTA